MALIDEMDPQSGRLMKEDGTCINIADLMTNVIITKKGTTAPASPNLGDLWVDTSGGVAVLKIYTGGSFSAV